MADRRDRSVDVYMRDGLLRKGKVLGHVDEKGRVREADTALRRGEELGLVDEKQKVRRKAGFLRRGQVVGRIRGNAAFVGESLLGAGLKVGYVDESGQVWQAECESLRSRPIGRAKGADPESALGFFLLKFDEFDDTLRVLEQKVDESDDRYAFLPRVRAMQRVLPELDALGDFDGVVRRLDVLEEICASDLGEHFQRSRDVIDQTVRSRPTPESIVDALRQELNGVGRMPEQADALVGRVRGALSALQEVRRGLREGDDAASRRSSVPPPVAPYAPPASAPSAAVGPLPTSAPGGATAGPSERESRRVDQLVELTFGSVDRVREELDRIRRDPEYGPDDLVESMRSAMSTVREASERFVADQASGLVRRRDERPARPSAALPASVPPPPPWAPPVPASAPTAGASQAPSSSTALVRLDEDDRSLSRAFAASLLETREAEQVFEVIDLGIERLRELDGVRHEGVSRLRRALDALRRPRSAPRPKAAAPSSRRPR